MGISLLIQGKFVSVLLTCILPCFGIWNNAKYEVIQNHASLTTQSKILLGDDFLDMWFCGLRIDQTTHVAAGLLNSWCQAEAPTFQQGYTYMIKTHQQDVYIPPLNLYWNSDVDEYIYMADVPGYLQAGSRIVFKVTMPDPWNKFAIVFRNDTNQLRPLKMKVWNTDLLTMFCWENAMHQEYDTETIDQNFPFTFNVETTIAFTVTTSSFDIYVDNALYHSYVHRLDYHVIDQVAVWFEGIVDSLTLHSVDFFLPSIAPPAP